MSTIRELAETVQAWHEKQIGQLQTILDTPKGTPIQLGDVVELTGDKAEGFRMGILIAYSFLGKLPFSIDTDEPAEACDACEQVDTGQTGEYPCEACGVPTEHDA